MNEPGGVMFSLMMLTFYALIAGLGMALSLLGRMGLTRIDETGPHHQDSVWAWSAYLGGWALIAVAAVLFVIGVIGIIASIF